MNFFSTYQHSRVCSRVSGGCPWCGSPWQSQSQSASAHPCCLQQHFWIFAIINVGNWKLDSNLSGPSWLTPNTFWRRNSWPRFVWLTLANLYCTPHPKVLVDNFPTGRRSNGTKLSLRIMLDVKVSNMDQNVETFAFNNLWKLLIGKEVLDWSETICRHCQ